jgi:hypothetical protein
MNKCKPPKCEYSIFRQNCIKPNPYIERLSYCTRNNISKKKCSYDIETASLKACKYHNERMQLIKEPKEKKPKEPKEKKPKEPKEKKPKEPKEKKPKEPKEKKPKEKKPREPKEKKPREPKEKKPREPKKNIEIGLLKENKEFKLLKKLIKNKKNTSKELEILKKSNSTDFKELLKEKEDELKKVKNEINDIIEKLGSSVTEKSKKNSILNSIENFEKELDIELDKLDDFLGKEKIQFKDAFEKKDNDSYISFLRDKKKINLSDRIKYYNILHKYIKSIKGTNCFNIIIKNNEKEYSIGDKIIIDKRIGDDSKYGITFVSHYKKSSNLQLEKYLIFATKLTDFNRKGNINEYKILKYLTKLNINEVCPHFPIGYGKLVCDKVPDDLKTTIKKKRKQILGSELYNKSHIFIFNELADGSLKQLKNKQMPYEIIDNALEQCIISVIFFNKYVNAYHNDCHYGNFLYHLIEPGGYFHYNIYGIDYYIQNIGYLWVIWDYGLIKPYYNTYDVNKNIFGSFSKMPLPISHDFNKLIESITSVIGYKNILINEINYLLSIYNYVTDINNMKDFTIRLLNILTIYSNTFKKSIDTKHSKIINKKPYIIN